MTKQKNLESPTKYIAKNPDADGYVEYTDIENQTWHKLISRQLPIIANRACQEFIDGLDVLKFSQEHVPQLPDVNKNLFQATGWQVAPVAALISFNKFFDLLASKKFPAATFIRIPKELDYLQEPDIFHELFGHCPMLTNQVYADFTEAIGKIGAKASPTTQKLLARYLTVYKWSQKLLINQNDQSDHRQNHQWPKVAENHAADQSRYPSKHETDQKSPRSEGIYPDSDERKHSHDPDSHHVL
jgi:monomeric phenylalanine-4-hydroxylase